MINVVDAIMGSGKTSASINYIHEHPEQRFLYVTPFVDETKRIQDACPEARFWCPSSGIKEYKYTKSGHFRSLIEEGRNVSITHKLYSGIDFDTINMIVDKKYTIIIDEVVNVCDVVKIDMDDFKLVEGSDWLTAKTDSAGNDVFEVSERAKYHGRRYADIYKLAKSGRLSRVRSGELKENESCVFWLFHKELLSVDSNVFIMTYLFESSPMRAFLDLCGLPYSYMNIERRNDGSYHFSDVATIPAYTEHLSSMIHICGSERLNAIGKHKTALSSTWTTSAVCREGSGSSQCDTLRKNLNTFFFRHCPTGLTMNDRLWSSYKEISPKLKAKGYFNRFLAYNERSKNGYRNCTALAYMVNIFMNPSVRSFFKTHNIHIDDDTYALSTMIQWIWRSAIRDGHEIWIYVPSRRMRELLIGWIADVERQYAERYGAGHEPASVAG